MSDETREDTTTQTPEPEPKAQEPYRSAFGGFIHHQKLAVEKAMKAFSALVPPDFKQYSREARKEFLLSFKVLIEGAGEALNRELNRVRKAQENEEKPGDQPSTTGKSKVKVEVS